MACLMDCLPALQLHLNLKTPCGFLWNKTISFRLPFWKERPCDSYKFGRKTATEMLSLSLFHLILHKATVNSAGKYIHSRIKT